MAQEQLLIKILTIGDPETGKSCLIKRFCEGRFVSRYIPTIGVDYGVKKMDIKNFKVHVNFFDLSGEPDYLTISKDFIKDA
jgi:DnaJ homolog subfamily C member 27